METHAKEELLKRLSTGTFSRPLYRQIKKAIDVAETPQGVVPALLHLSENNSVAYTPEELECATDALDYVIYGRWPFDEWASLSFERQMEGVRESIEFFGRLERYAGRYAGEVYELKDWLGKHEYIGDFDNAEVIELVHQAQVHYEANRFGDADASLRRAADMAEQLVDSFHAMNAPDWSDYVDFFEDDRDEERYTEQIIALLD